MTDKTPAKEDSGEKRGPGRPRKDGQPPKSNRAIPKSKPEAKYQKVGQKRRRTDDFVSEESSSKQDADQARINALFNKIEDLRATFEFSAKSIDSFADGEEDETEEMTNERLVHAQFVYTQCFVQ